ncbi:MAG: DUF3883 domain-containing protein, partial [Pirellulaceae bacterium]|nr:DUF3883 domain-containing protein [Pirellulaceae bacterium]
AHVTGLLAQTLGDDVSIELAPLKRVIDANRKSVRDFVAKAMPIVRAWCRQNDISLPEPWQQGEAQAVVRHVENSGLLDFEVINSKETPVLCERAAGWPDGMPETLDIETLALDQDEVEEEEKRREHERQRKEIERRSIVFAGSSLDTGNSMFAGKLEQLASDWLSNDETWFERSRQRTRLMEFQISDQSAGGGRPRGKGGGKRQREGRLTEVQRQAMGLASEWLAFQFLRRRHSEFVDETCWISENRVQFFGGSQGDDATGFDFLVKTPQVEWLYEVKSTLEDSGEFELTANELRVASGASKDGRRRYRILYVPYVFRPDRWCVLELPNPMGETTRNRFTVVGRGSVRFRFERQ